MDITVIGDRVELNGFTLARLTGEAPASLEWQFAKFLQGRDEGYLNGDLEAVSKEDTAAEYDDGYEDGKREKQDEIEDLKACLQDLIKGVEGNDEELIEACVDDARGLL